jgi:hypothetical protein
MSNDAAEQAGTGAAVNAQDQRRHFFFEVSAQSSFRPLHLVVRSPKE